MKWIYYIVVFFVGIFICSSLFFVHQVIALERNVSPVVYHKHEIHMDIPSNMDISLKKIVLSELDKRKLSFLNNISNVSVQDNLTYTFYVSSKTFFYEHYVSYAFFIETYTGGAHPNHDIWTVVYDTSKKEIVDIFDILSNNPNALISFSRSVRSDLFVHPSIVNVTWMMEGTKSIPSNYERFIFTKEGILFYFIPYSIAPYSSGTIEVVVPY